MRCFCCGGGLKSWQPEDDPWTEHLKWFPRCKYLQQHLPLEYVIDATAQPAVSVAATSRAGSFQVEPREIKARMDRPNVQTILRMGFSKDLIREVIKRRLTTEGNP